MKSVVSGSAGIDVQQLVPGIRYDLEYMRVSADEKTGAGAFNQCAYPRRIAAGIPADMYHQYPQTISIKILYFGPFGPAGMVVNIAVYRADGCYFLQTVGDDQATQITGVPDLVHTFQCSEYAIVEMTVGIGKKPYPHNSGVDKDQFAELMSCRHVFYRLLPVLHSPGLVYDRMYPVRRYET